MRTAFLPNQSSPDREFLFAIGTEVAAAGEGSGVIFPAGEERRRTRDEDEGEVSRDEPE